MSKLLFESLLNRGLISEDSFQRLSNAAASPMVSLHREIRILLYLGILLISSGVGVLVYKHIADLGHLAILGSLAIAFIACFGYCFWWRNIKSQVGLKPTALYDYIVLLGNLLLLIIIGYLQTQFQLFGNRWGLASFIPMVLLFAAAYYFDHKGVLSLAIINLAAWAGITINRGTWYGISALNEQGTIVTAFLLSAALILWAGFVKRSTVKPHFSETYLQFGFHGLFISAIAGEMYFPSLYLVWFMAVLLAGYFFLRKANAEKSAYFMVITCLYIYFSISYLFSAKIFSKISGDTELYANLFYYVATGVGMAFLLNSLNKKIRSNDRI